MTLKVDFTARTGRPATTVFAECGRALKLWACTLWALSFAAGSRPPSASAEPQIKNLITQRSCPLEIKFFGGGKHFGFKRAQVFLPVVGGFVAPESPTGDNVRLDFFFDSTAESLS